MTTASSFVAAGPSLHLLDVEKASLLNSATFFSQLIGHGDSEDGGAESEGSWATSRNMMVATCAGDGKTQDQPASLSCSALQPHPQQ